MKVLNILLLFFAFANSTFSDNLDKNKQPRCKLTNNTKGNIMQKTIKSQFRITDLDEKYIQNINF